MAAISNATSDHSSPNLRKEHPPIPITRTTPIPGIQTRSSPIANPSGGSRVNYKQRRGFERKSMKAKRQTGNALSAAAETTKPSFVLNIHRNMQRVKAQIDCSAMSIFLSPSLLGKLELPYEPAFIYTLAR
jgi:hypothetical protein